MSRIGNRVLLIPENVTVTIDNNKISVKGPKGELSTEINNHIKANLQNNQLVLTRESEIYKNFHGTANSNINNMIIGVTKGFKKELETVGVGYRFALKGNQISVTAGYSHPVNIDVPKGITVECPSNTELIIQGIDKCQVGQFAANIRKIREPEPYKGKGIRYKDEHIIRKVGKKAA